jgi:hypothetical protein
MDFWKLLDQEITTLIKKDRIVQDPAVLQRNIVTIALISTKACVVNSVAVPTKVPTG